MPRRRKQQLESSASGSESQGEKLREYQYEELKSAHAIRLLNLRPAGKKSKEIECELFEEDLDNLVTPYEALSWSWGGESWDQSIRIMHNREAYSFEVPGTLISALTGLRQKRQERILWIDAICINQEKPDEKNKQGKPCSMASKGSDS